jgi:hypothetical protein
MIMPLGAPTVAVLHPTLVRTLLAPTQMTAAVRMRTAVYHSCSADVRAPRDTARLAAHVDLLARVGTRVADVQCAGPLAVACCVLAGGPANVLHRAQALPGMAGHLNTLHTLRFSTARQAVSSAAAMQEQNLSNSALIKVRAAPRTCDRRSSRARQRAQASGGMAGDSCCNDRRRRHRTIARLHAGAPWLHPQRL